jgi:hypothetical protein
MLSPMNAAAVVPGSSVNDLTGAIAILAIAADPKAAQKRLDELMAERVAATEKLNQLKDAISQEQAIKNDVLALVEQETKVAAINLAEKVKLEKLQKELDDRETALASAQETHSGAVKLHGETVAQRKTELAAQERWIADQIRLLDAAKRRFDTDKADLDRKKALIDAAYSGAQ